MDVSTLLADPSAISWEAFVSGQRLIIMRVRAVQKAVCCPLCNEHSNSLHSHYIRQVADLPWHGVAIRLELHTRKFRCRNELCRRKVFCERLPKVVQSYARQTVRLNSALTLLAFALGGAAGARTASELNLTVSGDTLLRRIRYSCVQTNGRVKTPRVLGVDDFSFRRGISFGTILVDLEKRKPIDLLPDREAETLKVWLDAHPGVEIISRDRSGSYADGAGRGAPNAVQIADRFHLLQNLTKLMERFVNRFQNLLVSATLAIKELGQKFRAMIREQLEPNFDDWMNAGQESGIKELENFVKGIKQDRAAVKAALKFAWSQGQVEGQVNRLKMLKRQMYGRAKFDLLRARVLHRV